MNYKIIKSILASIHSYPGLKEHIHCNGLILPEQIETYHKDWISMCKLYREPEKSFFKPEWIPACQDNLGIFFDPRADYQLFEVVSTITNDLKYNKLIFFNQIIDLLENIPTILANEQFKQDLIFKRFELMT